MPRKSNASERDTLSYAEPTDPWFKKSVIRAIERMTGQPYIRSLYIQSRDALRPGDSPWEAALKALKVTIAYDSAALDRLPRSGPLIVVANHPFGILDGLVLCHLVSLVRPDFRVLINSALLRADPIRDFLLPIDFSETKAALETNLKSRATAKTYLLDGGCIVIFPAGGAATVPKPWSRKAIDLEWKNFAAGLIVQTKAPVVPFFFPGQNSRLFQLASHIHLTFRLALFFNELRNRIGSEVRVRIGSVIPFSELSGIARARLMEYLRQRTYALDTDISGSR